MPEEEISEVTALSDMVDEEITQNDLNTNFLWDEDLLLQQVKDGYTDRYLYESSDEKSECIGQVNIAKSHEDTIEVSVIIDSVPNRMNYASFKTFMTTNRYEVRELVS